jgi:hypothetical protein
MTISIEYLVIIEGKSSPALYGLCDDVKSFNKFIQTDSQIKLKQSNKLCYSNSKTEFSYHVGMGKVSDKKQRFFHVTISTGEQNALDAFVNLTRAIKRVVTHGGAQIETLWDDVSLHYSQKAYPYIHRIENLMRKVITYFMLTTVGKEWVNMASPEVVKKQIDNKQTRYIDALFQFDFIQLGDLLFKAYTTSSIDQLYNLIEEQDEFDTLTAEDILDFKARSNWDRYFSVIVDCDAAFLKKRWSQLYELRCEVAHNKLFGRADFENVVRLVDEVQPFLERAFESANRVNVTSEAKEQIAESIVSNISSSFGNFIEAWKRLEAKLSAIVALSKSDDDTQLSILGSVQALLSDGVLDENTAEDVEKLIRMRNQIVHDAELDVTENELAEAIRTINLIVDKLPTFEQPASFHADCIDKIESYLGTELKKRSLTTYRAIDGTMAVTCTVSKLHERKNIAYYWFGFHRNQREFLENAANAYASFGCGSADNILVVPLEDLSRYLDQCNITRSPRFYWHIQFFKKDGKLFMHQRNGDHVDMSQYLLS